MTSSRAIAEKSPPRGRASSKQFWVWALIGVASVSVIAIGWTRWLLSPDFGPTPSGTDPLPGWRNMLLLSVEVISVSAAGYVVWRYILGPLRRSRTLTFDGMMVIASFLAWFYDPVDNYFNITFGYNTYFLQFGSWANFIPGWQSPNGGNFSDPVLWAGPAFLWWYFSLGLLGNSIVHAFKRRYATMSDLGLFCCLAGVMIVLDISFELLLSFTQICSYVVAPQTGTIFRGHWYQFPLTVVGPMVFLTIGLTAMMYYRDDQGRPFFLRGVDRLKASRGWQQVISFFAVVGYIHTMIVVLYMVPFQYGAIKANTTDPNLPTYLSNQICGNEKAYETTTASEDQCRVKEIPILTNLVPLHVQPDGSLAPKPG
jgi:Spirocyclase AveC-like